MLSMLLVKNLALFCADFHFICRCSLYVSIDEVLKFTTAAALTIDVTGKSKVVYAPSTNGYVVIMECFLCDLLKEQSEQNW